MPSTSGAFTKLRNAVIIFVMSVFLFVSPPVRPSVCLCIGRPQRKNSVHIGRIFMNYDFGGLFGNV